MTTINPDQLYSTPDPLLCLSDVLTLIGVSESTWWAGVASGKFPPAVKCGRRSFWPQSAIAAFIESLKRDQSGYSSEMTSYLDEKNSSHLTRGKKDVNPGELE